MILTAEHFFAKNNVDLPFNVINKVMQAEELCEKYSDDLALKCLEGLNTYKEDEICLVIEKINENEVDIGYERIPSLVFNYCEPVTLTVLKELVVLQKKEISKEVIPILVLFNTSDSFGQVVCMVKPEKHNLVKKKKQNFQISEFEVEQDLIQWIKSHAVSCESQVSVQHGRVDIWIPDVCVIELKKNTVTAKDVCQVINYYAETKREILLVGKSASKDVVLTIENFNSLVGSDVLAFVSLSTIKVYLRGLLGIN